MTLKKKFLKQTEIFLRGDEGDFAKRLDENLDDIISFDGKYQKGCVEFVDMVNSTKITASLSKFQISKFYGIFLNSIAMIAKNYGGKVVKNIGDSLLLYFPEFENSSSVNFERPIECAFTMEMS
jgi:class 3 adenylate cyclase